MDRDTKRKRSDEESDEQNTKRHKPSGEPADRSLSGKQKAPKSFDITKYNQRYIALRFAYLGWKYNGFASQPHTTETIEGKLFEALQTTKLIASRDTCKYSRCGRTDKGVSAAGQVVALSVRSALSLAELDSEVISASAVSAVPPQRKKELDYVHILNKALPDHIRILAWAPVPRHFNARFSCLYRTYKYYFIKGELNIERMKVAAQKFVGTHDFRNFCKMDVEKVSNFERTILSFDVAPTPSLPGALPFLELYEFTITGYAFLWHQVRCMVAVLFLVGSGQEEPDVVDALLDVSKHPRKPFYSLASEVPLCLYDCGFEDIAWQCEEGARERAVRTLTEQYANLVFQTAITQAVITAIATNHPPITSEASATGGAAPKKKKYTPLLCRQTEESYEERLKRRGIASAGSKEGVDDEEGAMDE